MVSNHSIEYLIAYVPVDRRLSLLEGKDLPDRTEGAALFADISGFTPLTEALVRELGPLRGAEELTRHLNQVYDALIHELHCFRGSVIGFSGDAIMCWLDGDNGLRATSCALFMQIAMQQFSSVAITEDKTVSLQMKAAVATGSVRRFLVGDPQVQAIEVLAGSTLDHLALAEHHSERGEVVLDASVIAELSEEVRFQSWRYDEQTGRRFGVVHNLRVPVEPDPWPDFAPEDLHEKVVRRWLLPPVYERLRRGQGEFLAEFRPAVSLFLRFGGIDYDNDDHAGEKLDAYIRAVQNVLLRYEGSLIQLTMGDKGSYFQAAFGAPVAHEDDSVRAVSAAWELKKVVPAPDWTGDVQIGIARGRMRTGAYGGSVRRTYGVLGDEVNLAARLMQAAAPGQVLVSEKLYQSAARRFNWEKLPPLSLKGKSDPVPVYSLLGLQEQTDLQLRAPDYALPMVGRKAEKNLLEQKLVLASQESGQVIGITGEAGMGKSRLVAELISLASEHGFIGFGGECQSYGTSSSYLVWQNIWRAFFGLDPQLTPAEKIEALEAQLSKIDPGLIERLPLLGPAVNLPIQENEFTRNLDAKLRKTSLEALLLDCLKAKVKESRTLFLLENCQWLDPLSHDLLDAMARVIADLPVIIIMVYRPFDSHYWKDTRVSNLGHFTEVRLGEFSQEEAQQFIELKLEQFFGARADAPPELVKYIITRAEGNPFYIEELFNFLQDRGIDPSDPKSLEQLNIPSSLHSLILTRIDQRTESQKITIKLASIVGRMFSAAWLWGAYPELGRPEVVKTDLEVLRELDITAIESSEPELVYLFKHIVTQEVTYESLPFATRAMLHDQLAQFIERNLADSVERTNLLAFHYYLGQSWQKAMHFNFLAAKNAQEKYANESAIEFYKRTLWVAEKLPPDYETTGTRIDAHESLGEVFTLVGRYDEALDQFTSARKIIEHGLEASDQPLKMADLCRKTAYVYERYSEYEVAFKWLEKGLGYLDENRPTLQETLIYLLGTGIYRRLGRNEEAVEWCQKSLSLASKIRSREGKQAEAQAYYNLGGIALRHGNLSRAVDYCQQSLKIYQQIDHIVGQAKAYNNLGVAYKELGDWESAIEVYSKSLEINRKIGDIQEQGFVTNNLGNIFLYRGEWDQAEALFEESNSIWKRIGAALPDAVTLSNLAQVQIYQGKWDLARENLARSQVLFEEVGSADFLTELERRWGEYYLRRGSLDDALEHVQRSIKLAEAKDARLELAMSLRIAGEVHVARGDYEGAKSALIASLSISEDLNSDYEVARTGLSLVQLAHRRGESVDKSQLEGIIQTFEKLGAQVDLKSAHVLFQQLTGAG